MKLHDILWDLTTDSLKTLIAIADVGRSRSRKADKIDFLLTHLQDATFWAQLVKERLSEAQRAAIAHVAHEGWPAWDPQRFQAIYGETPDLGIGCFEKWDLRSRSGEHTPMALIFFYTHDGRVIPEEIQALLKPLVTPPAPLSLPTIDTVPETVEGTWIHPEDPIVHHTLLPINQRLREHSAGQELVAILQMAQAGKLRFTAKTGLPTTATARAVQAHLKTPDFLLPPEEWGDFGLDDLTAKQKDLGPILGFAWPMLLKAAGLLKINGASSSLSTSGRRAITEPLSETLRAIFNAWMGEASFDELSRVNPIKGQGGRGQRRLTPPPERRAKVADAMRQLPDGEWVMARDLLRLMIAQQKKPTVLKDFPDGLYVGDSRYGSLMDVYDTFDLLEGSFTRCFLLEVAATLGVVDVAYVRPDIGPVNFGDHWNMMEDMALCPYNGLTHIRLTPLGGYILGVLDPYTPSAPRSSATLRVLPNLDVVITGPPGPQVALVLDLFAERAAETTWRLTRHGLLDAIDSGHELNTLVELLSADPEAPLPPTALDLLADVKKRSAALSDEGLWHVYLADDPAVAAEVSRHGATQKACKLVGDRHLLVKPDKAPSFRKAIIALGFGAQIKAAPK